jgi:hypothetical protein
MSHDFFHMSFGAGVTVSTMTICLFQMFRMMCELLGDIIESLPEAEDK